jgi:hypothetical protein
MNETKFDQDEQKFIKYLNSNTEQKRIQNYLDPCLHKISIDLVPKSKKVAFRFEIRSDQPTPEEIKWSITKSQELQLILVKITRLISYLENAKLAYSFIPANNQDQELKSSFGQCAEESKYIRYELHDIETINGLIKLADKIILPTPSLLELEKCNFKFPEQKRFEISKCLSTAGIIVAILLSVIGIYFNIYLSKQSSKDWKQYIQFLREDLSQINDCSIDIKSSLGEIKDILSKEELLQSEIVQELHKQNIPELKKQINDLGISLNKSTGKTIEKLDNISNKLMPNKSN